MEIRQVLHLNRQHFEQLMAYCTVYRAYLWQYIMPTPERNQALRDIQALQGKLEKANEQEQPEITLPLTDAEKGMLKQLFNGVTQFYGAAPPSEQRIQQLAELTAFRVIIERMLRQEPPA